MTITILKVVQNGASKFVFYEGGEVLERISEGSHSLSINCCHLTIEDGLGLSLIFVYSVNTISKINTSKLHFTIFFARRGNKGVSGQSVTDVVPTVLPVKDSKSSLFLFLI
ncbi:hypothetical protein [Pseudomonas phage PPAT]|nr:hypothetical protein [Pseudomonas phage PPAT]